MGKELQEAKEKILELEARNKQNDTDVEMLKGEHRSVLVFAFLPQRIVNKITCFVRRADEVKDIRRENRVRWLSNAKNKCRVGETKRNDAK